MKRNQYAQNPAPRLHFRPQLLETAEPAHYKLMNRQRHSMNGSPNDKTHRSAMPETTQQHCNQQVYIRTDFPFPVPTQRNIQIIFQP